MHTFFQIKLVRDIQDYFEVFLSVAILHGQFPLFFKIRTNNTKYGVK